MNPLPVRANRIANSLWRRDLRTVRLVLLLLLLASGAHAQEALRLSAGGVLPLAGDLGPVWQEGIGARGSVALDLYGGEARLSLDLATHDATDDKAPDFTALNAMLGWGPIVRLGRVRLIPGAEIGAGRYEFDDDGEFENELSEESELVAGAYLRASVSLASRVDIWAETGVRRTFFSTPATTVGASGGIAVRLGTPAWIRALVE